MAYLLGRCSIYKPTTTFSNYFSNLSRRSFAKAFERTKVHSNVGTIGHVDHGKTTLSAAITKVISDRKREGDVAQFIPYDQIDKAKAEKERGITINSTTIEYETPTRHYSHTDCPGHRDYVKNMITGAAQLDTAVLVVAATDGVAPQTKEHILLAKQIGIPNMCVFINKCDEQNDPELLELVEMEISELLEQYDFDTKNMEFIRGSALAALQGKDDAIGKDAINKLLDVLDSQAIPARDDALPFMMPIENVHNLKGIGTVVTGKVERGTIKIGDPIDIIGLKKPLKANVAGIEMFHKQVKQGITGDSLGLAVRIDKDQCKRGMVAVAANSLQPATKFKASCYFLTEEEGGRKKPIKKDFKFTPQFYLKTANITGKITIPQDREFVSPGDNAEIEVELVQPGVFWKQLRFAMRESGDTVAVGVITSDPLP